MSEKESESAELTKANAADPLVVSREFFDQGHPGGGPLTMRVSEESTGFAITAVGPDGPLGEVFFDYFNNTLRAVVYHPDQDEPVVVHTLQADVVVAMRTGEKPPAEA